MRLTGTGPTRLEFALCAIGFAVIFLSALLTYRSTLPHMMSWESYNYWFDADTPRVLSNMMQQKTVYGITQHHPLLLLAMRLPASAISRVFDMEVYNALGVVIATVAAAWSICLYAVLRLLDLASLSAAPFALLAVLSSSALFLGPIPETILLGSLTILLCVLTVAIYERIGWRSKSWHILASVGSLSITTTHWMAGLAMLVANYRFRRAVWLATLSFSLVVTGAILQGVFFPGAKFFLLPEGNEGNFVLHPDTGGLHAITSVFFSHAVVMPEVQLAFNESVMKSGHLTVQSSAVGVDGWLALLATAIWLLLLILGVVGVWKMLGKCRTVVVIVTLLSLQYVLHVFFGVETFLYSLAWLPLLIVVSAMSMHTRFRKVALVAVLVLLPLMAMNNVSKFHHSIGQLAALTGR